jgi:hypothetical protein
VNATPWVAVEHRIKDAPGTPIADTRIVDGTGFVACDASAAHIVRCVNAHDELISLVRDLSAMMTGHAVENRQEIAKRVRVALGDK